MNISTVHRYNYLLFLKIIPGVLLLFLSFVVKGQEVIYTSGPINVANSVGADGDYTTLSGAFTSINSFNQTAASIVITVNGNTTEPSSGAVLNAGNWATITLYPTGSYSITGDLPSALVNLDGADNVNVDGRINQTGIRELKFINYNTGTAASTLKFGNSAQNNTVQYCFLSGGSANAAGGIVFFDASTTGTGNNGNALSNNAITGLSATNRPVNAVYSQGSSTSQNNFNTVIANDIFDFLNSGAASNGIQLAAYSANWTIFANSFYESAQLVSIADVEYAVIRINNSSGNGFIVENNFIGGNATACGGLWTKTGGANNTFYGIYLSVGNIANSNSVQGNTIRNIKWTNSLNANWTGIHVDAGLVDIGTINGNIIGSDTGTGNIMVTLGTSSSGTTPNGVFGINFASSIAGSIQNNTIGAITTSNSNPVFSTNFYGIAKTAIFTPAPLVINNNLIGSLTTPASICANSPSTGSIQEVYGIYYQAQQEPVSGYLGFAVISNNTITNLINNTTYLSAAGAAGGRILGIHARLQGVDITGNTIRDLSASSANTYDGRYASVTGIMADFKEFNRNISGNSIYNLSNTSTVRARVNGIFYNGSLNLNNRISQNFIHSLSVSTANTGASFGDIYGIQVNFGSATWSDNIINLGTNVSYSRFIYGIYEIGAHSNNFYHNTIIISGNSRYADCNTYAFFSSNNTNLKNIRNNIFHNDRTFTAGPTYHCAVHYQTNANNLTADYNNYYVSPTGYMVRLGPPNPVKLIATLSAWQLAFPGQDMHSYSDNSDFALPGGTASANYIPGNYHNGIGGTGIITDYSNAARNCAFTMGAFEREFPVGTPAAITVSAGAEPTCVLAASDTTTYTTTAVNNSFFAWALTPEAAGTIAPPTDLGTIAITWNPGWSGTATIYVYANGCAGPSATITRNVVISGTVGTPGAIAILAGAEPTCQTTGAETTTYATTALYSTGFNWTISNALAGSINPATGEMTWATGFSGSVDIRVTATGCNGPSAMVIRTVNITPSVETPTAISISAGAEPTCQTTGTETTTYATTALYSTGFNWTISNALAGSINPATGEMIWATGFSGSVDIRVTATGCNGPSAMVSRQITVGDNPLPFVLSGQTDFCAGVSGYIFTTEPLMSGYTWTISSGGVITAGSGTNAISVTWNTAGPQTVSVNYTNTSGCTAANPGELDVLVTQPLPVSISIDASANPVNEGIAVTFTATPVNGGDAPSYQWKVNGNNTGTDSNAFSYFPANGDIVVCELVSNAPCTTGSQAMSNQLTIVVLTTKQLNLHVLFEGLYAGGGIMNQANDAIGPHFQTGVADQLTIELRNPATGEVVYALSNVNVNTSGNVSVAIPAIYNGSYYLYIKHRNSITTSTANPVLFDGGIVSYDFSIGVAQAFGSTMKNSGGVAVIYGGDVNQDGSVDIADMTPVDNDAASFVSGYLPSDVNGDGSVDIADMTIVDNNSAAFITAVLPF